MTGAPIKVLQFGATGQVSRELLARAASEGFEITALDRAAADLSNPDACAQAVRDAAADTDVVIIAAAYTAVDKAETERELADTVNGAAPGAIAKAAAERGWPVLHISTDYVFDGQGEGAFSEDAAVDPINAYGASKLIGEEAVAAANPQYAIFRTAWVFSPYGANFVKTMLRVGAQRDVLTVVDDQHGGPTAAGAIAKALFQATRAFKSGRGKPGIYHFSGAPATTWARFAEVIFEESADWLGNRPKVERIPSEDFPTPAKRPKNSRLDCAKIEAAYGVAAPDWRSDLREVLEALKSDHLANQGKAS